MRRKRDVHHRVDEGLRWELQLVGDFPHSSFHLKRTEEPKCQFVTGSIRNGFLHVGLDFEENPIVHCKGNCP
jgi:hypothetical protein